MGRRPSGLLWRLKWLSRSEPTNPTTGRIIVSVHVQFMEDESGSVADPSTDSSIVLEVVAADLSDLN